MILGMRKGMRDAVRHQPRSGSPVPTSAESPRHREAPASGSSSGSQYPTCCSSCQHFSLQRKFKIKATGPDRSRESLSVLDPALHLIPASGCRLLNPSQTLLQIDDAGHVRFLFKVIVKLTSLFFVSL